MGALIESLAEIMRAGLEFFYGITNSYGIAIIVLTLVIRLILTPFAITQTRTTEKMKIVQPEMKELQKKYKKQPEVQQKKMMELYKKHKVNPLGGCLPILIQLPFIFAFFSMLRIYDFGGEGFLWVPDLTEPDPLFIWPILAGLSTYVQGSLQASDPSQQKIQLFMPVFMTAISITFPVGVTIYWVASGIFMVGQQMIIAKKLAPAEEEEKQ